MSVGWVRPWALAADHSAPHSFMTAAWALAVVVAAMLKPAASAAAQMASLADFIDITRLPYKKPGWRFQSADTRKNCGMMVFTQLSA